MVGQTGVKVSQERRFMIATNAPARTQKLVHCRFLLVPHPLIYRPAVRGTDPTLSRSADALNHTHTPI